MSEAAKEKSPELIGLEATRDMLTASIEKREKHLPTVREGHTRDEYRSTIVDEKKRLESVNKRIAAIEKPAAKK